MMYIGELKSSYCNEKRGDDFGDEKDVEKVFPSRIKRTNMKKILFLH